MFKFKTGDKVKFLNDVGGGVITEILPGEIAKVLVDGFELPISLKDLIKEEFDEKEISVPEKTIEIEKEIFHEAPEIINEPEIPVIKKYKAGDKVKFLNDVGGGIITEVTRGGMVKVLRDDGIELPFALKEIMHDQDIHEITIPEDVFEEEMIEPEPELHEVIVAETPLIDRYFIAPRFAEVDMHIWELTDHYNKMTNGEMLNLQLDFFRLCLESAIDNNYTKVVFIHGVGNGRLKHEIHQILDEYKFLDYHAASMKDYGVGATEVLIKHNKF